VIWAIDFPLYREQNCPPVFSIFAACKPLGTIPSWFHDGLDRVGVFGRSGSAFRRAATSAILGLHRGAAMFKEARCAVCHVPEMKTGESSRRCASR
jgi:hypothetical protein